jgi:hypothetical protein
MVKDVGPPDELLLELELELLLELELELLLELELELELELLLELELELLAVVVLSLPPPQAASTKLLSNERTMMRAELSVGRRVPLIGMIEYPSLATNSRRGAIVRQRNSLDPDRVSHCLMHPPRDYP